MGIEANYNGDNDVDMQEDENGVEPEQFDISGSPAKEPQEEIVFASRTATPSERRLMTFERTPANKRTETSYDATRKRFSMDVGDDVASIDENVEVK